MRPKSIALLLLALGCGLVASVAITQVMARRIAPPETANGDSQAIFVAMTDIGMGVVVKMNPTMLGLDDINYLLHDRLGYDDIQVNKKAVDVGLRFDDGIEMIRRLRETGRKLGLTVGVKFSNTLEVINHKSFFPKDEIMYLSGLPLHVCVSLITRRSSTLHTRNHCSNSLHAKTST